MQSSASGLKPGVRAGKFVRTADVALAVARNTKSVWIVEAAFVASAINLFAEALSLPPPASAANAQAAEPSKIGLNRREATAHLVVFMASVGICRLFDALSRFLQPRQSAAVSPALKRLTAAWRATA